MGDLKNSWKSTGGSWKETGKGLGHAFRDLGKSLVKTASTAAQKVDDWANGENDDPAEEEKTEE